jgi:hypothetical protein
MVRILLFFHIFFIFGLPAQAIKVDSVYYVRRTPFLNDLLDRSKRIYPIFPQSNFIPVENGQIIIKTPENLYVAVMNTGIVFKYTGSNDTVAIFRRIDKTVATGYNIDALFFSQGEELYNFGGYGFWKNNGILRKYNFKDAEWDVYPLSQEIIPQSNAGPTAWYDHKNNKIHVPFERIINAGIAGVENIAGVIKKDAHVLDVSTGKWENKGTVSKEMLELNTDDLLGRKFNFERGQILIHNYELYWIDFESNKVNVCQINSFVQTFNRITKNHPISYIDGEMYFCYDPVTHHYDSIRIDLSLFKPTGSPVWENDLNYYYAGVPLILVAAAALFYYHRRRRSVVKEYAVNPTSSTSFAPAIQFEEQESRLLQLLYEKTKRNMRCTIEEINYCLGLKDKNQGVQKKMRSDVINSINQKYRYLAGNDVPLVLSVRSEQDKRYFEYYVDPEKLAEINSFINNGSRAL